MTRRKHHTASSLWNNRCIKAAVFTLAAFMAIRILVVFISIRPETIKPGISYILVGDLGSSGSRIYVYTYVPSSNPTAQPCSLGKGGQFEGLSLLPGWEELLQKRKYNEKKPGVSSLAAPPYGGVEEYFQPLLEFANSLVPKSEREKTPIFFYATAGLRSLAVEQNERIFDDDDFDGDFMLELDDDDFGQGNVSKLLIEIKEYFREKTPYFFRESHIKILKGEEEAMFDWISLQQMLQNGETTMSKENNHLIGNSPATKGIYPMGMIDTGGASSQISYIPEIPQDGNMFCDIYGSDTSLVAKSFLGYGMYESRDNLEQAVIARALNRSTSHSVIVNPCFLRGNIQHTNFHGTEYEIIGGGDYDRCFEDIKTFLFQDVEECEHSRCAMQGAALPNTRKGTKYLAIDNANRAAYFFKFQGYTKLSDLEVAVREYCETKWEVAQAEHPGTGAFRLKRYCYEGTYLIALFHLGYKFPMDSLDVAFVDYVGQKHLNWPLGAAAWNTHRLCSNHQL